MARGKSRPKQNPRTDRHATTKDGERASVVPGNTKLSKEANEEVCEPLQKLTSIKTDWKWNRIYQDLYYKAKTIVKKDACMKFYSVARLLYMETDVSCISLGT